MAVGDYSLAMAEAAMMMTQKETVKMVESGTEKTRNMALQQSRAQTNAIKNAETRDCSEIGQMLKWSASYFPETFPLTMTALTAYIAIDVWIDSLWTTTECEFKYQVSKWSTLGVIAGYLVLSGYRESTAKTFIGFIRSFWVNLLLLPLLLMSTVGLCPIQCYIGSPETVTLIGVSAVVGIGSVCYLYGRARGQRAGGVSGDDLKVERVEAEQNVVGVVMKDEETGELLLHLMPNKTAKSGSLNVRKQAVRLKKKVGGAVMKDDKTGDYRLFLH